MSIKLIKYSLLLLLNIKCKPHCIVDNNLDKEHLCIDLVGNILTHMLMRLYIYNKLQFGSINQWNFDK
jgi:hypothetical protein